MSSVRKPCRISISCRVFRSCHAREWQILDVNLGLSAASPDTALFRFLGSMPHPERVSTAAVFLYDAAPGLGQHSINPETPGNCWCEQIYGVLPASTYLRVVEEESYSYMDCRQELALAEAMGQVLLVKTDQSESAWERHYAERLRDAEELCKLNRGCAPWGCSWFEQWRRHVDRMEELHVFYHADRVGQGKLPCHLLCDARAREEARPTSGLGFSQTVEVAYLDKLGLSYREHDVREFDAFLVASRRVL